MALDLTARIQQRKPDPRWKRLPRFIAGGECINCQECVRRCPVAFAAIVVLDHGPVIIPELCSGCPQCVKACPMDCIYEDLEGQRNGTPEELWKKVEQREKVASVSVVYELVPVMGPDDK
ncbi:DUF362 domain-containing protein [Corynebacterium striatum]|uniref:DUF362 domain-containing protein n=1 Tax=Corynebacterium striatum TaxID=43770 RepID=UPI003D760408